MCGMLELEQYAWHCPSQGVGGSGRSPGAFGRRRRECEAPSRPGGNKHQEPAGTAARRASCAALPGGMHWLQGVRPSPPAPTLSRPVLQLRLTVSGSAACPTPIMERWEQLSGAACGLRLGACACACWLGTALYRRGQACNDAAQAGQVLTPHALRLQGKIGPFLGWR